MNSEKHDLYFYKYKRAKYHFIKRVIERYEIYLDESDYDRLLEEKFVGVYTRTYSTIIGYVTIGTTKVWCTRIKDLKLLTTALPCTIETDINQCIFACFPRPVREIAKLIHQDILKEMRDKYKFQTVKDAAIHFFKYCRYPTVLIDQHRHEKVCPFKICRQIQMVINGENQKVKLGIIKREG